MTKFISFLKGENVGGTEVAPKKVYCCFTLRREILWIPNLDSLSAAMKTSLGCYLIIKGKPKEIGLDRREILSGIHLQDRTDIKLKTGDICTIIVGEYYRIANAIFCASEEIDSRSTMVFTKGDGDKTIIFWVFNFPRSPLFRIINGKIF